MRLAPRLFLRANIRYSDLGLTAVVTVIGGGIALGVAGVRQLVMAMHHLLFGVPFEMHFERLDRDRTPAARGDPVPGRVRLRDQRVFAVALAAARHCQCNRGQRAARRPHVIERQPEAYRADDPFGRGRRLGRLRSGVHPARRTRQCSRSATAIKICN